MSDSLDLAVQVALWAHKGQVDKGGLITNRPNGSV